MSEGLLGEVTATYVLKNRENGWLKYALEVLAAEPYLRTALIGELCKYVRKSLERRLPGYEIAVWTDESRTWFSVDITHDGWGDFGVSLGNWKVDASDVAIGVYNYGNALDGTASAQIRDCLATKKSPWHKKRDPKWIWNVWLDQDRRNWSRPDFLMRIADDRAVVVGEVTKDLLEIVELAGDVLKRIAQADSV